MIKLLLIGVLIEHGPLVILVVCLLLLWLFGHLMSHARAHLAYEHHLQTANEPLYSTALAQPISDLSHSELEKFKKITEKKDKLQLAIFFAIHQPSIQEIGELLEVVNKDLTPESVKMIGQIAKTKSSSSYLESEEFSILEEDELQNITICNQRKRKVLGDDFIAKFGNLLFMENFIMYNHLCHNDPAIFHVPVDDDLRRIFDIFVKTGMAIQGNDIPFNERLHILNLEELQDIGSSIGIEDIFSDVDEAVAALSTRSQSKVRLSAKYPTSELFLLIREAWDVNEVEQEWSVCNAYAKLVCAKRDLSGGPHPAGEKQTGNDQSESVQAGFKPPEPKHLELETDY